MQTIPHCVIAVDIGSSAVRAALIDGMGQCLSIHRVERSDAHSGLSFDAEALWRDVVTAICSLEISDRSAVLGVGVSAHIGTVVIDANHEVLGLANGWADQSGTEIFTEGLRSLGTDTLATLGRPAVTGGALPFLLSLKTEKPKTFAAIRYVLSPKDFIVSRLTGLICTDVTNGAYTLASSVATQSWHTEVIESFGIDSALFPAQVSGTEVVGNVSSSVAQQLGITSIPVIAGGPDGTVGASLVLATSEDAIADVAGTTDVLVRLVRGIQDAPHGSVVNPYTLPGYWTAGGSTGMTGGAVAHWAKLMALGTVAEAISKLEHELERIPPGSDGLLISTLLSGSRFPHWRSGERGAVHGMTVDHSPAHFLRSAQEGAAFVVREGLEWLSKKGSAPERVLLAGGAAKSRQLAQLRADVLGRDVEVCVTPDVSLLGTAMLTMLGIGMFTDASDASQQIRGSLVSIEPRTGHSAAYDELYHSWLGEQPTYSALMASEKVASTP